MIVTPVAAAAPAYAAMTNTTSAPNFFQELVQFIAQKFGLDQNQVQTAINQFHTQQVQQRQQKMEANEKSQLDRLVSQGKITASQEQQILAEQTKLRTEYNHANFKSLTPAQRKQQFQNEKAEIKTWSQSTGINAQYLHEGFGSGRFGNMRGFHKWNDLVSPTATPSPGV